MPPESLTPEQEFQAILDILSAWRGRCLEEPQPIPNVRWLLLGLGVFPLSLALYAPTPWFYTAPLLVAYLAFCVPGFWRELAWVWRHRRRFSLETPLTEIFADVSEHEAAHNKVSADLSIYSLASLRYTSAVLRTRSAALTRKASFIAGNVAGTTLFIGIGALLSAYVHFAARSPLTALLIVPPVTVVFLMLAGMKTHWQIMQLDLCCTVLDHAIRRREFAQPQAKSP